MKVYLFSINSDQNNLLNETFNELKKLKGQFEFVLNTEYNHNIEFESINSFDSLFDICDDFKINNNIPSTDIAILISPLTYGGYFSYYNSNTKNIFVCTKGFGEIETPYLVCHQIIENILQCVSNFNTNDAHNESIGCINDMCNSKIDITLKLRTADICTECIDLFLKGGLTNNMLFQSMKFLENLRSNFLLQDSYNKNLKPLTLSVKNTNNNLEIWIEDTFIKFTKTELFLYYILCVAKEKGNDFSKNIAEKKKNKKDKAIYIDNFINESRQTFLNLKSVNIENYFEDNLTNVAKNVSIINDKLNDTLGFNLAKFYTIDKMYSGTEEKKIKEHNASIKNKPKLIKKPRAQDFEYIIELFLLEDYNDYYKIEN